MFKEESRDDKHSSRSLLVFVEDFYSDFNYGEHSIKELKLVDALENCSER